MTTAMKRRFLVGDQVRMLRSTGEHAGQRGQIRSIMTVPDDTSAGRSATVYTVFLKVGYWVTVRRDEMEKV